MSSNAPKSPASHGDSCRRLRLRRTRVSETRRSRLQGAARCPVRGLGELPLPPPGTPGRGRAGARFVLKPQGVTCAKAPSTASAFEVCKLTPVCFLYSFSHSLSALCN